ncbi:hypothetical protein AX15_003685 [Amanita polypyramis BW_CC]|nr:hypothetical protein AX15_003685 [Amanita polypyramis BW_CC]
MAYTAPALLIGLGARIVLDTFIRTDESNLGDVLLVGAWQGVALQYAHKNTDYVLFVGLGVVTKLFFDFTSQDATKLCASVLGSAVGFICTDFITQIFEEPDNSSNKKRRKSHTSSGPHRQRIVQFRRSVQGDGERPLKLKHAVSDITSIDSDSELIPAKESMTPMEREIAALRARASLADSERRRFKEERKWAVSQGNMARASQMKWEVKRYTVLMENFNKQADAKVLEAAQLNGTLRQTTTSDPSQLASSSKTRLGLSNGSARQTDTREAGPSNPPRTFLRPATTQRSAQDRTPHHRQFSGTLKSAMRDSVR